MDRDTLIFIAFCVFILLLGGTVFGSSSGSGRKERRQIGVLQMKRSPLPAKSRRRYFILIQVIVLGGLLIFICFPG